jgi:hypothetical protein
MLHIFECQTPSQKSVQILEFLKNPKACFIVSDLQSKLYWQNQVTNPIFRASEFWRILLSKTNPEFKIVSEEIFAVHLQKILDQITKEDLQNWGIQKIKSKTLRNYFFELFPLFSHPDSDEILQNWFAEKKIIQNINWESIYIFCLNIWNLIKQEQILPEKCVSSFLMHSTGYEYIWKSPLLIDLGGNLASTEAELILTLSQQILVQVIEPAASWFEDFYWIKWPYQQLRTRSYQVINSQNSTTLNNNSEIKSNKTYLRFQSPLSEIKMAIEKIKNWQNSGVPLSQIFITAPQIESYWTPLKWHLEAAQIDYQKDLRIPLIELLDFKKLIAKLKCVFLQSQNKTDLESALYINEPNVDLKYDEFTHLYSQMFSNKDYYRHPKVIEKLSWQSPDTLMSPIDFLNFISKWQDLDLTQSLFYEDLKTEITQSASEHFRVEIRYWIYYLEQILFKKEKQLKESPTEQTKKPSVQILPLTASYAFTNQYGIFLGLDETSLRFTSNLISGSDVVSLLNKTGHLLNHPDRNFYEFLLRWSEYQSCEVVYSFAETNWKSEELSPSVFWLLGHHTQPIEIDFCLSRIKLLAKASVNKNATEVEGELLHRKIQENLNNPAEVFKSLSPSGLETLNDCAFKYYAERVLGLTEDRSIDLDFSPMTLGNLYHKLCEILTEEPIHFELSDEDWNKLIEKTLRTVNSNEFLEFQKSELSKKLKDWGHEFLKQELEWRKQHPESRVYGRELKMSGLIDGINFIGKIDRIDFDQKNQYSIVDYKSSVNHLTGPNSWIKNNHLQLLCYIYASQKGWLETNQNIQIVGSYYLSLKTFEKKGFTLKDSRPSFLSPLSSRSELTDEDLKLLMQEFEIVLINAISKLKAGSISPIPRNENICQECEWKQLCRAPHLNM